MKSEGETRQVCQIRVDAYASADITLHKFTELAKGLANGTHSVDTIYKARDDMLKSSAAAEVNKKAIIIVAQGPIERTGRRNSWFGDWRWPKTAARSWTQT